MKKYYVIITTKNGYALPAYVINDVDNDIDYHLNTNGDAETVKHYETYNTKGVAVLRANAINKSLKG